ncbi:RHS repeat-associated core domain-containing protein, partial [bacterium]
YNDFDSELQGTYHINNRTTKIGTIFKEYHQYELPLISENYIRKYTPNNTLDTTILRNVVEYNQFGRVGRVLDANGNIYQSFYDKANRLSYVWHPYDFPPGGGPSDVIDSPWTFDFDCNKLIDIYSDVKRRLDSLNRLDKIFTHSEESKDTLRNNLMVGVKYSNILPIDTIFIDSSASNTDEMVTEKYNTYFTYMANSNDQIFNKPIDSLRFVFDVAGAEMNNFIHLTLSNNKFNFERRIIIGATMLAIEDDAPTSLNNLLSPQQLVIDVTPLIDSLKNLSPGDEVKFKLSSSSERGWIELLEPCLQSKASDTVETNNIFEDYTYHFEYKNNTNQIETFSKIDDFFHTYNSDWEATWANKDGRYKRIDIQQGIFNKTKGSNIFIGHPDNPMRIDTFSTLLSGFGSPLKIYDAYGEKTEILYNNLSGLTNISLSDLNTISSKVELGYPYNLVPNYDSTDQDYMGFVKKVTSIDEKGMTNVAYFDVLGKMRLKIIDSVDTYITTKYNYDKLGRIKNIIQDNSDTTMYWYDNLGRIKYKYKSEIGFVSYSYDKEGRLRFTQNEMQSENEKLNYYQYDDLGRITVLGEASIETSTMDSTIAEPVYNSYDDVIFERITDNLDPNKLYYQDYGINDVGILTLNSTLFDGTLSFSDIGLDTTSIYTGNNIFDSHDIHPSPYFKHNYTYGMSTPAIANYKDFEDVGLYPNFVRKAVYYDVYPNNVGNIWGGLPSKIKIDSIAGYIASNGLGRPTAIAYRDFDGEDLNYTTFAYDARGRVTKIIRYNGYLGFDGVFYEYNSANQIIKEISADPLTQMVTWYSYDQSGRMDSIWVSLDSTGSGFGVKSLKYLNNLTRESGADIAFKYDRNGRTDSIIYDKVDIIQAINYSNRGWIDSLVVNRNSNEILKVTFNRDINGLIDTQKVSYWTKDPIKVQYDYDNLYRLKSFDASINGTSVNAESYEYDRMGNRTKKINTNTTNYTYGSGSSSNKLLSYLEVGSTDETKYEYNENGGIKLVKNYNTGTMITEIKEQFEYLSNGLLKSYTEFVTPAFAPWTICTFNDTYSEGTNSWIYRYNENGQLESKKLYTSDSGDYCGTHSWMYNKFGAFGDLKAVYHGKQNYDGIRDVVFYPEKYLSANGLIEIYPDGTKEYNILDNMNSTRLKVKENDTTLIYSDYEPYGEGQLNTTDEIPKRGYMGNHKSRENGYFQMGARLYNSETGRFMSVDPMLEYFTEQSPYNYAFNNPVMFDDPSGLAPDGEKSNKTMASGYDAIGDDVGRGYWTEVTSKVVSGVIALGLDSPIDLARRVNVYGTEKEFVWVGSSGGGGGTSGGSSYKSMSWGEQKGSGGSTRKLINPNYLRAKSVVDQVRIESILNSGILSNQLDKLLNKTIQTRDEFGALIVQDLINGEYFLDNVTQGTPFGIEIPNIPTLNGINIRKGRVHTHSSGFAFSFNDIFFFADQLFKKSEFSVVLTTNYIYVLLKTDVELAEENFNNMKQIRNKINQNVGNSRNINTYINALDK